MTKFLFMDERYADAGAPAAAQVVALTGVLVPSEVHPAFREGYYTLLRSTQDQQPGVIQQLPEVHAMNLLPGADDEVRFAFLEGLVALLRDHGLKVYRVAYLKTPVLMNLCKNEPSVLGLCFAGLLWGLHDELVSTQVWPVMETDGSPGQDLAFAGMVQNLDHLTHAIGSKSMSIDNANLGEVLYSRKRSAHGAVVDCVAYLLHAKYLRSIGLPLTAFKSRLADIADGMQDAIARDETIDMNFGAPPDGYVSSGGPARYATIIEPSD